MLKYFLYYEVQINPNTLMGQGYYVHFVTKTHDFVDFFYVNDFFKYICSKNNINLSNAILEAPTQNRIIPNK